MSFLGAGSPSTLFQQMLCPNCRSPLDFNGQPHFECQTEDCLAHQLRSKAFPVDETGIWHLLPVPLEAIAREAMRRLKTFAPLVTERYSGWIATAESSEVQRLKLVDLLRDMVAAEAMAKRGYYRNVVDWVSANELAQRHERYEELFLDERVRSHIDRSEDVVLVELGCGPGRYLIKYGSRVRSPSRNEPLASFLDALSPKHWEFDDRPVFGFDPTFEKHFRLIVGIDYSPGMLSQAVAHLTQVGLHEEVNNRIQPILAVGQRFAGKWSRDLRDTHKICIIAFQTLGNQSSDTLRVDLLKSAKSLVGPGGEVIVSVNSLAAWGDKDVGARRFYGQVSETVGSITDEEAFRRGVLRTNIGLTSEWFSPKALLAIFARAGMEPTLRTGDRDRVIDGVSLSSLPLFQSGASYVDLPMQERLLKKILIAEARVA